ncbi:hypothetical protein N0V95_000060 [Ascochyta clinopodiicola]|nr:hypothetical protein N0V95_000060 [Ascochyta clinopodiicola]
MAEGSRPPTMSQFQAMEHLRRLNAKLTAEKEAAVHRAARRHRDMMYANRRAERAEQALTKEARERRDDQVNATTLFCAYKDTINALELGIRKAQRYGPSKEQFQAMQLTNARLQSEVVEQKNNAAQRQTKAEETIQGLYTKIDADKSKIRIEAAHHYEERLAQARKQLSEKFSRKAQVELVQTQKLYQECKAENEGLRQKLQQATQMVDWERRHTQRQATEQMLVSPPRIDRKDVET